VKITGTHTLAITQERAYSLLQDPEVLAKAMPGCDQLTRVGPDEYDMKLKMAIASAQGLFAGKVKIEDQHPPESFKLVVDGTGKVGFMKGVGVLHFKPQDGSTEVKFEGEVQIGGMIAGVGQRLVETTAKFIIRKFFEKLSEQVGALSNSGSVKPTIPSLES
jgi:carbon monoxide dehydrogenase subunit G